MTQKRREFGKVIFASATSICHMIVDLCREIRGNDRIRTDVMLMIGTCCKESDFFFRKQIGGGPALGIFQVEPDTALCNFRNYLQYNQRRFHQLTRIWFNIEAEIPYFEPTESDISWHLENNDLFCTIMARYKYLRDPDPIPHTASLQAEYWHRVYKTEFGAGDQSDYLRRWMAKGQGLFEDMEKVYDLK